MDPSCKACKYYHTANLETVLKLKFRYGKKALCADHLSLIQWRPMPPVERDPNTVRDKVGGGTPHASLPLPSFIDPHDGELLTPATRRRGYAWRLKRYFDFGHK